ncbi:uncharacterized protein MONOS_11542 [Monocercomonoides exilis]|uniref:uncharacterized protein n=1 Tax=Monocercomonoides exilis TaxID=2049356 RepID=UPI00355949BA|nr:hypothetical protein MONOS_11542 [Monocercomonoides exilis]|eukprot:MONOS_11542.1-p1 / transcript=MONOS_11542.1 / gene=MONOS_11542 / organism=Monocercomonoides_exilis_PA203 / gene_product=unspecified product / transcript_product=unspecified product / location=Mono_scaffold00585:1379-3412(-) / protein_length=451 / sequence_SO=supercontig / SO=protein_coding / is_pseudo=false
MEMRESSSKGAVNACLGSLPDDILKIIFEKCNCSEILSLSQKESTFDAFYYLFPLVVQMCENQVSSDNSLHAQDLPSARLCISRHFQISAKFGRRLEREPQIRGERKGMEGDIAQKYSNKWWYIANGIILLTVMYFDYFWKHIPIFLFIWPYFGLAALIFAAILVSEYEQAASFSKYLFLLLDIVSAGLMLMFFVIASLKADAHIYRVLVSLTSHEWHDIFLLPIRSILIIFARFFIAIYTDKMFGKKMDNFDPSLIVISMALVAVVVLPFLFLARMRLEGSVKLHFGFCVASLIVPFAVLEYFTIQNVCQELRHGLDCEWEKEEIESGNYFGIQKFKWLRMKLGLRKLSKGEAVVGFKEPSKTENWMQIGNAGYANRERSEFRLTDFETKKAMRIRRYYYAKLEGCSTRGSDRFAKHPESLLVRLFNKMNTLYFKCSLVLVIVAVYLFL